MAVAGAAPGGDLGAVLRLVGPGHTAGRLRQLGGGGSDIAENRELGDVTTLTDSSVMNIIKDKLPAAPSED